MFSLVTTWWGNPVRTDTSGRASVAPRRKPEGMLDFPECLPPGRGGCGGPQGLCGLWVSGRPGKPADLAAFLPPGHQEHHCLSNHLLCPRRGGGLLGNYDYIMFKQKVARWQCTGGSCDLLCLSGESGLDPFSAGDGAPEGQGVPGGQVLAAWRFALSAQRTYPQTC